MDLEGGAFELLSWVGIAILVISLGDCDRKLLPYFKPSSYNGHNHATIDLKLDKGVREFSFVGLDKKEDEA